MAKYIDVDNLLKRLRARKQRYYEQGEAKAFDVIVSCIVALETEPAVDVEPVKRGKWKLIKGHTVHDDELMQCSNCHEAKFNPYPHRYCPFCGAKMEGVTE